MKAALKLHQKRYLSHSVNLEIKLWEVSKSNKYPDGIKYSLIVVNTSKNKKVLMDNHSPKGHHYHLDNIEFDYNYQGIERLIEDFYFLVKIHLGVIL